MILKIQRKHLVVSLIVYELVNSYELHNITIGFPIGRNLIVILTTGTKLLALCMTSSAAN